MGSGDNNILRRRHFQDYWTVPSTSPVFEWRARERWHLQSWSLRKPTMTKRRDDCRFHTRSKMSMRPSTGSSWWIFQVRTRSDTPEIFLSNARILCVHFKITSYRQRCWNNLKIFLRSKRTWEFRRVIIKELAINIF